MANFEAKSVMLKNMILELQCYLCKSVPSPFENGMNRYPCNDQHHLLCENCKEKCKCGSNVINNPSKLIIKLYEDFPWYCGHFPNGCREIMLKEQLKSHEKNCIYKSVYCPLTSCGLKVPFNLLTEHIDTKCKNAGKNLGKIDSDIWKIKMATDSIIAKPSKVMQLILNSGKVFYLNLQRTPEASMIWVQFHGLDDELSNYEYSITSSHCDENKHFSFTAPVLPLTKDPKNIPDNNLVFTIKPKLAQKYAFRDGFFRISIRIRCLKEEAKDEDIESGVSDVSD